MPYPKIPYVIASERALLLCERPPGNLATVPIRRELPGNIIVIHGVNDVGTSFAAVEQGMCQGLNARMYAGARILRPASYRLPDTGDKSKLETDPDAVFFKRKLDEETNSPVIPFYWGYRERSKASKMVNGQTTDRYGNRLDKDMAKNGGPFGNATNTLPDMWNRGLFSPLDLGGDPVRPLMTAPGRMYMVLAAQRLAALIAMIRDYDKNDAVSIVAHSQGCLISLLAQAFLFDAGQRPADTLILTHPPYSLVEDTSMFFGAVESSSIFGGGKDAVMNNQYYQIHARQTLHARLQTLAQIVQCVVSKKHGVPAFARITDDTICHGMAGNSWKAEQDRDNRGKVYLYFCPEDMTVALGNMQGIGWQGIPDFIGGHALSATEKEKSLGIFEQIPVQWKSIFQRRQPLQDIGAGFFQRVFTNKQRIDPASGKAGPVLVGQAPHNYALRLEDEDDHAHAAGANRSHRSRHEEAPWPPVKHSRWNIFSTEERRRKGLRRITGEALPKPVAAVLDGGQIDAPQFPASSSQARLPKDQQGPCEDVDPIDAAIAISSMAGLRLRPREVINDPRSPQERKPSFGFGAINPGSHYGPFSLDAREQVEQALNRSKSPDDWRKLKLVKRCPDCAEALFIDAYESPNEARLRWQHEISPKSFHGAIIGNADNHRNVTAYDVAIGGGKASSDPRFYRYLCAVADWRLQENKLAPERPSVLKWEKFLAQFGVYWAAEPLERKQIIQGNARYYSSGVLPGCVPGLRTGLPSTVVCETSNGIRTNSVVVPKTHRPSDDIPL